MQSLTTKKIQTMKKLSFILILFFSSNIMFSQNEFEYVYDGINISDFNNIIEITDILEMDNGDFMVFGIKFDHNYFGRFSNSGELLYEKLINYSVPGYYHINHEGSPIIKSKDGGFYIFTNLNPIYDTNDINYQGYFEAKIVMDKLDENLELIYSKEMTIPLDSTIICDDTILYDYPEIEIGTVLDEGDGFVICYEKYAEEAYGSSPHIYGFDSTFFIKTDYDLNILKSGSLGHLKCNELRHRNHLLYDEEDDEYLYYTSGEWNGLHYKKGFYLYRFDSDFNYIGEHYLSNTNGNGVNSIHYQDGDYLTSGITFKRTSSNTTIMMAGAKCGQRYTAAICLEINDEAKMLDSITFARNEISSTNKTTVPRYGSIDWTDENRIFIGATSNSYYSPILNDHQYLTIKMINKDLNILDELYYDLGKTSALWTTTLKATQDGGCMIAGHFYDYNKDPDTYYNVIKKFPPEAFDNIKEAHAHGLKYAVAYPNPGEDILNIRTGLRNAVLSVYDINGRKIHEQEITDDLTSVDASKWQCGTYIWKLGIRNEELGMKEVESGKWVK